MYDSSCICRDILIVLLATVCLTAGENIPKTTGEETTVMKEKKCVKCTFRAKYDRNPKSIIGRIWRWHINFCPGWKSYMKSLPNSDRVKIKAQYNLK